MKCARSFQLSCKSVGQGTGRRWWHQCRVRFVHPAGAHMPHRVLACMFVFCRWYDLVPLQFCPIPVWSVASHLARFGAAGDMMITARDMRTGLAFGRIKHTQLDSDGHENRIAVSMAGGWSVNGHTYKGDYLHPAFFSPLFSDLVRLLSVVMRFTWFFARRCSVGVAQMWDLVREPASLRYITAQFNLAQRHKPLSCVVHITQLRVLMSRDGAHQTCNLSLTSFLLF